MGTGIGETHVTFKDLTSAPRTPAPDYKRLYFKNGGLHYVNDLGVEVSIDERIAVLEDIYVKTFWFEQVNSGTSGTVTLPTGATIILDAWAGGVDALASTLSGGVPTLETPRTSGGVLIAATLNAGGNYTLTGTPSPYPVAVVYCYKVRFLDYDKDKSFLGYEASESSSMISVDVSAFAGNLTSADNTVQKALDTIDDLALGGHTQGTDTTLGTMTADIAMDSHQVTGLAAPDAAGEAIRQTTVITEVALDDAIDKAHSNTLDHANTLDHSNSLDHANTLDHSNASDHTQGTDQGLDTGGANEVSAAQAKAGYTHSGAAHAPSDAVSLATVKGDVDVADAISKKHVAVTIDGTSPLSLSTQAISLKNDAAAAITEIDTAALADSDTKIPTSKRAKDYADTKVFNAANLTDHYLVRGDGGARGVQASTILVDDSGRAVNPSQPAFSARLASTQSDVTGDGTAYQVIFGTEIFDIGNNYDNSTGVFTAPITGKYKFTGKILLQGVAAAHNDIGLVLVTSNRTYYSYDYLSLAQSRSPEINVVSDMDAGDTTYLRVSVSGGTKVVDVYGDADMNTYFVGILLW